MFVFLNGSSLGRVFKECKPTNVNLGVNSGWFRILSDLALKGEDMPKFGR